MKMFRQKLFKRVMPMLLSMAMVFQTMPATAYAAEPGTVAETEQSDAAVLDGAAEDVDGGGDVGMPDGETLDFAEDMASDGTETTEDPGTAQAEEGEDQTTLPYVWFQVNLDAYANGLYGYAFDYTTSIAEAEYVKENPAYGDAVKTAITNAMTIYVDGEADNSLKAQLKYQWKKFAGEAFTDLAAGAEPHDAGLYALEVSLDAADGKYDAADPLLVALEVKPAQISLDVEDRFAPGSTVKEVKDANKAIGINVHGARADLADYVQSVTWKVEYAHADEDSAELAADTAKLQKNRDYVLVADAALKDAANYELKQNRFQIFLGDAVDTEIVVTYAAAGGAIGKVYDGSGFAFNAETPEYTAKVVYTAADGTKQELEGAEIQASWCNAAKQEYEDPKFVPTNAGRYYYKLFYTDENGSYADAEEYVDVEIRMVDVVVDPQPLTEEQKVYEGMTPAEVLKNVSYKVYRVENGVVSTEAEQIDEYFWGTAYSQNSGKAQSYQPVFAMEQGTKAADGTITWRELGNNETLEPSSDEISYRIVFAGQKTLYDRSGNAGTLLDINNAQGNYCVDTTEAAIARDAETVEVLPSTLVVIDPSGIPAPEGVVEDGTNDGSDLTKPMVRVYNEKGLYANKGEYKKAVVKAAAEGGNVPENADSLLVYTWQQAYPNDLKTDEQGGLYMEESRWYTYVYNDVENIASPYKASIYRLKISLKDPTNAFHAEPVYRYYVIQPQYVVAVVNGEPAIYADGRNTVEDLLEDLYFTDGTAVPNYANLEVYPATVTEAADGTVSVEKGETPIRTSYINTWIDNAYEKPTTYFYVERQVTEGAKAGTWVRCDLEDVLEKDVQYRLCVASDKFIDNTKNYSMGRNRDLYGRDVKDYYYPNESLEFTCMATDAKEVTISLDESRITGNEKTYDGKTFESLDALKELVKVTAVADNTDVTEQVKDRLQYLFCNEDLNLFYLEDGAVHAGSYTVYIVLQTDETYRHAQCVLTTPYVIEQAALTVTPTLREEIPAGMRLYGTTPGIGDIVESYRVTGYAECDREAVEQGKVLEMTSWKIHERTASGTTDYYGILKSTEVYYVLGGDCDIYSRQDEGYPYEWVSYGNDYKIKSGQMSFVPVRQAAEVGSAGIALKDQAKAAEGGYSHTVTAEEGIPYSYSGAAFNAAGKEGNYFLFKLYAPGDFWEIYYTGVSIEDLGFVYRNRIEQAEGFVLDTGWEYDYNNACYRPYITAAFDASKKKASTFEVVWGEDYVESYTIDLKNCILEADFRKAVAPKSIAFNKASTKMAVGETQQLDVKLTKAQMNDTILLGYSSSNEQVLQVSESGFVTALAASKSAVTIEVYPCQMVDGVKTPISGAKHAKVNIKVSEVTAPKVSKVAAKDTTAIVSYKKPADGYRREIYVLEGKKTVQQFESAIADVKNGDLSAFVYTQFVTSEYADKKGIATCSVTNLLPTTNKASEYTVYVRNVAGLRRLDNGDQVAVSHAGTVKTFKTIKSQATAVDVYFNTALKGQTAAYGLYYDDSSQDYIYGYGVPLAKKSATVSVKAKFLERYSKDYSDQADYIWRDLSDTKDVKSNYTLPKMAYYVTENYSGRKTYSEWLALSTADRANYFSCADGYYYEKTVIASVDKKGKVSLKGKGKIYIIAVDTNTGLSDMIQLFITASPTAVTCKAIKMIPGQTIVLSDYLNYQEGKTKIVDYGARYADLETAQLSDENFKIDEFWSAYGYKRYAITALKPGAKLEFEVADAEVAANGGKPVKVKITTSAVEPVKNLKAGTVYDDHFTVTFNYPESSYDFRVDLRDARGRVIYNALSELDCDYYDTKTKKYVYSLSFDDDDFDDAEVIARLSNYTVSVTAVCDGVSSKEVKTKVKTTNIPASYRNLGASVVNDGCPIIVNAGNSAINLSNGPVLKTGNTYTLNINVDNTAAQYRLTDTLTWKSTNTKVASVKANAGSYTAQLKAVNQGETRIEVTSKITKKVIARWTVKVNATGEANGYFGDNEPYNGKAVIANGTVNGRDVLEVTADNAISVGLNPYEEQWYVFTAPAYGQFSYSRVSSLTYNIYDELGNMLSTYSSTMLQKGEKRYIRVRNNTSSSRSGYVKVNFTQYQELALGDNQVKAGKQIVFRAPEDNYYTFTRIDGDSETILYTRGLYKDGEYTTTLSGTTGKEYTVRVTRRETQDVAVGAEGLAVTLNAGEEKWFKIAVDEANVYQIYSAEATGNVRAERYTSLVASGSSDSRSGSPDFTFSDLRMTQAGGAIYVRLTAPDATAEAPVTLKLYAGKREPQDAVIGGEGLAVTLNAGEEKWFKLTADETNVYRIYSTAATGTVQMRLYQNLLDTWSGSPYTGDPNFSKSDEKLDDGKVLYVRLTAPDATAEAPVTLKLHVSKRVAQDLTVGGEGLAVTLPDPKEEQWFKIPVDEVNCYTVYSTETTGKVYAAQFDSLIVSTMDDMGDWDYFGEPDFSVSKEAQEAGGAFYVRLTAPNATAEAPVTLKLHASKRIVQEETLGPEGLALTLTGEEKWFKFTADEAGLYRFYSSDATATASVSYYTSLADKNYQDSRNGYYNHPDCEVFKEMEAGEVVYISVDARDATNEAPVTLKFYVSKIEALENLSVGTKEITGLVAGEYQWYSFTAAEDGYIQLSLLQDDPGYASLYYVHHGDLCVALSSGAQVHVAAGDVIYLRVHTNNAAATAETPDTTKIVISN
ncbi:MAG: Ig-like domain-containing protein [Muribaculum sp.]|nr:Ig-like domain-containing protein [Muribaculum sp.]